MTDAHAMCLIGGTGRSGSTLLWRIIRTHPAVASLKTEARFLTDPDGIAAFYSSVTHAWSPYAFDTALTRLERLLRELGSGGPLASTVRGRASRMTSRASARGGSRRSLSAQVAGAGRNAVSRLLGRYWEVDLSEGCPSYGALVERLIDELVEFRYPGRWMGMTRSTSGLAFGSDDVARALRTFCRDFVACVCRQEGATHFVEDSPFNLIAFGTLHELLPESRLVHIHRDPRDVVASYLDRAWSPTDPVQAARFYAGIMRRWEAIRARLPESSFIEVGLSALVREPEPTLRGICAFWGLPWQGSLLDVDLSRSNDGRWRRDIPANALAEVEAILGPYIDRYSG